MLSFSPRESQVDAVKHLGADFVIDKSSVDLWAAAKDASPSGFAAVFDANGVATLQDSYDHLDRCGRLVVYGFHTNLPVGSTLLSPLAWIKMAGGLLKMPHFDPMLLTLDNKSILGFNLSFFAEEKEVIKAYLKQVSIDIHSHGTLKKE